MYKLFKTKALTGILQLISSNKNSTSQFKIFYSCDIRVNLFLRQYYLMSCQTSKKTALLRSLIVIVMSWTMKSTRNESLMSHIESFQCLELVFWDHRGSTLTYDDVRPQIVKFLLVYLLIVIFVKYQRVVSANNAQALFFNNALAIEWQFLEVGIWTWYWIAIFKFFYKHINWQYWF